MVKTKMIFTTNAIVRFTRNSAGSETNAAWPHGSGREIFSINSLISFEDQSIIILILMITELCGEEEEEWCVPGFLQSVPIEVQHI